MAKEGRKESEDEEETDGASGSHCTSHSTMEQRWAPTNRRSGRQYEDFRNSCEKWIWLDGAWRESRGRTEDEVQKIDDPTQALGFGERSGENVWGGRWRGIINTRSIFWTRGGGGPLSNGEIRRAGRAVGNLYCNDG